MGTLPKLKDKNLGFLDGLSARPSTQVPNKKKENVRPAAVNVMPLPPELLYEILDYLPAADQVAFTFCRWDFFKASTAFIKGNLGPSFRNLDKLVDAFDGNNWPKDWLHKIIQHSVQSEQTILRDFDILGLVCKSVGKPESILKETVHQCAAFKSSTIHGLLSRGFDEVGAFLLQQKQSVIYDTFNLNMTVLHIAVLNRAPETVKALENILLNMPDSDRLEYVNQMDDLGHSALSYAITISFANGLDAILRMGADLNRRDRLGSSPLMDSCYLGCREIIEILIEHGADISMRNAFGLSALEHVMNGESQNKPDLLQCLAPHANQWQLNEAFWHAFQHSNQYLSVLIKLGADPKYVGLPVDENTVDESISEYADEDQERLELSLASSTGQVTKSSKEALACQSGPTEPEPTTESEEESCDNLLVRMNDLSINDDYHKIDAWCCIGVGRRLIIRLGPPHMCKYVFDNWPGADTRNLQNVSDSRTRMSCLTYTDNLGIRHRKYGKHNIQGIYGVVIRETPSGTFRKTPATYVKLKWTRIAETDAILCNNGYSWTTRSDLIKLVGQTMTDSKIRQAWIMQEKRYARWSSSSFMPGNMM